MAIENEIKYSVKKLPDSLENYPKKEIKQGFYSDLPSPLRIRESGDHYTLTKKFVTEGKNFRLDEIEMPIKKEEFDLLWPHCKKSISKTRYLYPLSENLTAEIDIFHGKLEGFVNVEVEFPNEKTREDFVIPDWFDKDLTYKDWATNSELSEMSLQDVQTKISEI